MSEEQTLLLSSISRKQWRQIWIAIWRHDFMVNDVTHATAVEHSKSWKCGVSKFEAAKK